MQFYQSRHDKKAENSKQCTCCDNHPINNAKLCCVKRTVSFWDIQFRQKGSSNKINFFMNFFIFRTIITTYPKL